MNGWLTDCGEFTIPLQHTFVVGCLLSLFAEEGSAARLAVRPARHHADGFTSVAQAAASWSRHRRASPWLPLTLSTLLKMASERLIAGHRGARVHSCLRCRGETETPHLNWANVTFRSTRRGAGCPAPWEHWAHAWGRALSGQLEKLKF